MMMKYQPFFVVALLLLLALTKSTHSLNGVENLLGFGFNDDIDRLLIFTQDLDVIEVRHLPELMDDPSKFFDLSSHYIVSNMPIKQRWPELATYLTSNTSQPVQYMFSLFDGTSSLVLNTIKVEDDDAKKNSVRFNLNTNKTSTFFVPHETDKNVSGPNSWIAMPTNRAGHLYSTTGQFIKMGRHSFNESAVIDSADDYMIMCKTKKDYLKTYSLQANQCDSKDEVDWPVIRGGFIEAFSDTVLLVTDQNILTFKRAMFIRPSEGHVNAWSTAMNSWIWGIGGKFIVVILILAIVYTFSKFYPQYFYLCCKQSEVSITGKRLAPVAAAEPAASATPKKDEKSKSKK